MLRKITRRARRVSPFVMITRHDVSRDVDLNIIFALTISRYGGNKRRICWPPWRGSNDIDLDCDIVGGMLAYSGIVRQARAYSLAP